MIRNIAVLTAGLLCIVLFLVPGIVSAKATARAPILQIGILPTLSARALLKNYHPVQVYLERVLKRPVELTTAPDFKTFHFNTIEGKYDLVVTAAHLARLAQMEAKYVPLAVYKAANGAVLIEARDQTLRSIQDLKGKTLAFGDRNSLNVMQTVNYLQEQGLREGVDYTLQESSSHSSAAYSVQNHNSMLAVTSPSGFKNIPDAIKGSLAIFSILPPMPSLTWMAHPRMASDIPKIKAALLGLTPDIEEGKQFYDATGYIGMREVSNEEMKALDSYAWDVGNRLKSGK